jgi:putative FmdB family regulatory protein
MPLYDYECKQCGHKGTEFRKMANVNPDDRPEVCPECTAQAYTRQISCPHTDLKEFATPIELYSIALDTDDEIREFLRKCPDVEVCTDPASDMYGIPVARHRKGKLQALAAAGYVETNSERVRS